MLWLFSLLFGVLPGAEGFTDVGPAAGLAAIPAKRIAWADFDNDGWPDLLVERTRIFLSRPAKGGKRRFVEVPGAVPAGLCGKESIALAGDVNGDGNLDIFLGMECDFAKPKVDPKTHRIVKDTKGRPVPAVPDDGRRNAILLGDGKGHFHKLEKSGVEEPCGTVRAAAFLDYDRDGVLDLFVGHWYREYGVSRECYSDRLYRGIGGGKFVDVTQKAGLLTEPGVGKARSGRPTMGVATADIDNDGRTDLVVCTYGRQWNRLWRNNGDGTFTDVGAAVGWDGDGIRHGKHPKLIRRRDERPYRANGNTFDVSVGDIDNDGDLDLFSAEITHWWAGESSDLSMFLLNGGVKASWRFDRRLDLVPARHALPWKKEHGRWNQGDIHSTLFDYDNDGWLDLVIASSDYPDDQYLRFYRNLEGKGFVETTQALGIKWRSPAGISVADFDRDGRLDLVCARSHFRLTAKQRKASPLGVGLWRNRTGRGNHWIALRLRGAGQGKGANRFALGARVRVIAGKRRWIREVQGGAGHAGHANDTLVHFGLGKVKRIDRLEVDWPGGWPQTVLENQAVDRYLEIPQPERR